ncbi:MAG: hypothetical protein K8R69_00340 [Deltaproteobacteria bacterium]|nr:hypothetical protein [Deltaproteobacteria bacterium]
MPHFSETKPDAISPFLDPSYNAAQDAAAWLELSAEQIFELTGDERKTFLNAYITQDIKNLGMDRLAQGAFLTQKGKLVSESWVLNLSDKILLLFPPGFGERVEKHLATFLMFANVTFRNVSQDWAHFALLGPKVGEFWKALTAQEIPTAEGPLQKIHWEGVPLLAFVSPRFGTKAVEALLPAHMGPAFRERLASLQPEGLEKLSEAARETLRLEAGIPKMGVDMGEEHLVAEVGLNEGATSFTKGCYLGQETTARVQSRGHVNRRLIPLQLSGISEAALPLEIFQGEKKVGILTSAVKSPKFGAAIGLGTVSLQALENSEELFAANAEGKNLIQPRRKNA